MSYRFPKKFVVPSFDCYTRETDPVQHLRAYQVRMAVHSYDDHLLCRVFSSSLRGVVLDWFYSLQSRSLRTFEEVSNAFFNQYTSWQEFKKNDNYFLTIKMNRERP